MFGVNFGQGPRGIRKAKKKIYIISNQSLGSRRRNNRTAVVGEAGGEGYVRVALFRMSNYTVARACTRACVRVREGVWGHEREGGICIVYCIVYRYQFQCMYVLGKGYGWMNICTCTQTHLSGSIGGWVGSGGNMEG
jgi:hypothetical protein